MAAQANDKASIVGVGLQMVSDPANTASDFVNFAQTMDWNKAKSVAIALGEGPVSYTQLDVYKRQGMG